MKNAIFTLGLLLLVAVGYSQTATKMEHKPTDPKLVGCWRGSEVGQQAKGLTKYWVSCRFEDGTSTLLFIVINKNGKVKQITENGKWWVENGNYYELHNYDGLTDVYTYDATEANVKFKSVELMGMKDSSYSFVDYRIEDK